MVIRTGIIDIGLYMSKIQKCLMSYLIQGTKGRVTRPGPLIWRGEQTLEKEMHGIIP